MSAAVLCPASSAVLAVIVTHEPDLDLLDSVMGSVATQVGRILVFDNASCGVDVGCSVAKFRASHSADVVLHSSARNVGIASAINAGFSAAREGGFTHVLVMDQDSVLGFGMVAALLGALGGSEGGDRPVAAVGPVFKDRRTGAAAPFVRIGPLFNQKVFAGQGQTVEADFLISSGTLVPLAAVEAIGGMDEGLFIDNVDLEWSFRARHRGFRLLGVGDAQMGHAIGDRLKTMALPGFTLDISLHGPIRQYYMTRNRITLYRRAETPWQWVTQDIPRMLLKFIGMSLFIPPRARNCRYMLRGMIDALRGRQGPFAG